MKRTLFAFACIMVVALAWWQRHLIYPMVETAPVIYPTVGIDVSHHQGPIDWQEVASSDVQFVFMKATEGRDFKDTRFTQNWREARAVGLAVGAYHFFSPCRSGAEQAAHFINTVPKESGNAFPHAVDAEQLGPCTYGTLVEDLAGEIDIFLNMVGKHYGVRPVIYTDSTFHKAELDGKLSGETFWLRSLVVKPSYRGDDWVIWQYHNRGKRPGISGPVDLNVMKIKTAELTAKQRRLNSGSQNAD
ncbi:MAG: GH25 family lysozyme [Hyphomicrobiales bacterium]